MFVVRALPSAKFSLVTPGSFRIFFALQMAAALFQQDVIITSACDGIHSGPDDPHKWGRAYDIRTHGWVNPDGLLNTVMDNLDKCYFYGFLEDVGTPNEHLHVQVRHGVEYPPMLLNAGAHTGSAQSIASTPNTVALGTTA